jgi:hypothetical protein
VPELEPVVEPNPVPLEPAPVPVDPVLVLGELKPSEVLFSDIFHFSFSKRERTQYRYACVHFVRRVPWIREQAMCRQQIFLKSGV